VDAALKSGDKGVEHSETASMAVPVEGEMKEPMEYGFSRKQESQSRRLFQVSNSPGMGN
jgi:hypothetical protein